MTERASGKAEVRLLLTNMDGSKADPHGDNQAEQVVVVLAMDTEAKRRVAVVVLRADLSRMLADNETAVDGTYIVEDVK